MRLMADATSTNFNNLPTGIMRAGYVTGTPDIKWTLQQISTASVTIDQGGDGSPVGIADVRDVEAGAWTMAAAVSLAGWTAPRPTIYTSLDNLPALEQAGWKGDVWVADYTGTQPSSPPAMPAGMTCVAVQYTDQGGGGTYDLSVVFDPIWPEADVIIPGVPGTWLAMPTAFTGSNGDAIYVGYGTDGTVWWAKYSAGAWTAGQL